MTNDSNFVDKSYVDNKLTSVYKYKGSVKSYDLLPLENEIGDVYNVEQAYGNFPAGTNFAWTSESTWDGLSGSVDLSAYIKTAEVSQIGKTGNLADANDDTTHRWVSDTEKNTWNGKQNALSFDNSPMADSSNPVKSSGIKTALDLKADKTEIPTALSQLTGDTTHRVVTDTEKTKWNNKADTSDIPTSTSNLTNDSGFITSVKTVDGQSIVGSGNININNAKQLTKTSGTDTITVEINDSNKAQVKVKTPNQETIKVLASEDYVDSAVSSKANKNDIPTKTSDLNNDSSFITSSSVDSKISTATTNLGKLKIGTKWYTASLSGTQLTLTSS